MPSKKTSTRDALRESWPPTQVLLQPSVERDDAEVDNLDLSKMDEDPLIYFLTPTPTSYGNEDIMDFDMEFDAGIEDSKHPPQIVRSVSPSSLGGLSRPPPRPPTPPRSPATPELEFDIYGTPDEQYDYMQAASPTGGGLGFPRRLKSLAAGKFKSPPKHDAGVVSTDSLFPPAAPHSPDMSNRGRAATRPGPSGSNSGTRARRSRGGMPARLSPHAWREPSPDVWSIEEETQEEVVVSEMGDSGLEEGGGVVGRVVGAVDIPAAKPKKRVRFVLPDGSTY